LTGDAQPWPTELRLKQAERALDVTFEDGSRFRLPAEYLRVESPSAEVQGHSPEHRQTVPAKINVGIERLEPVGRYAVRIVFDDGHDTGIFTWRYLHQLGTEQTARWQRYLDALASKGLSRNHPRHSPGI
jgi:DUF971 family protein